MSASFATVMKRYSKQMFFYLEYKKEGAASAPS